MIAENLYGRSNLGMPLLGVARRAPGAVGLTADFERHNEIALRKREAERKEAFLEMIRKPVEEAVAETVEEPIKSPSPEIVQEMGETVVEQEVQVELPELVDA